MHRRLVVEDSGLLVSREMSRLLDPAEGEPEYREFLRSHIIVPAMRSSVTSFSELADIMIRNGNYQDLGPDLLRASAAKLDALQPAVAFTATDENRQLMHALVEAKYLSPDTWHDIGLGEAAKSLAEYVQGATANNGSDYYRATEFWQFADELDGKKLFAQAQKVRAQISTLSLGVMAAGLNLHMVFPAAYAECVDRVYGTHRPWTATDDGKLAVPEDSISDDDLIRIQGDVRYLAGSLSASDISEIRSGREHRAFLSRLSGADKMPPGQASAEILDAMRRYYQYLEVFIGARLLGEAGKWRKLRSADRWIGSRLGRAASAAGVISTLGTTAAALTGIVVVSAGVGAAIALPPMAMSACLYLLNKEVSRQQGKLEVRARTAVGQLVRPQKSLAAELYGPVDMHYWSKP